MSSHDVVTTVVEAVVILSYGVEEDEWLAKFEESQLAFLYQEKKASGEDSTFFKLTRR